MQIQPGIVIKAKTNDSLFVSTSMILYPDNISLYDINPMDPSNAANWKLLHNRTYQLKGEQFLVNLLFRSIVLTGGIIREAKFNTTNNIHLETFRLASVTFHDSINLSDEILPAKVKGYIDMLHNLITNCINPMGKDATVFKTITKISLRLMYGSMGIETNRINSYINYLEHVLFDELNLYRGLNLPNLDNIDNKNADIKYNPLPDYFNDIPETPRLIPFNAILPKANKTELYVTKEPILSDAELTQINSFKLRNEKFRICYKLYVKTLSIYGAFIREFIHKSDGILGFGGVDNTESLKNIIKSPDVVDTFNVIEPTNISILLLKLLNGLRTVYQTPTRNPSFKRIPQDTMKNFTNTLLRIEYDLNDLYLQSGVGDIDIRVDIAKDFMKEHYDKKPPYDIDEEKYKSVTVKKIFDGTNKIDLLGPVIDDIETIAFDERDITSVYGGFNGIGALGGAFLIKNIWIVMIWIFIVICLVVLIYFLFVDF